MPDITAQIQAIDKAIEMHIKQGLATRVQSDNKVIEYSNTSLEELMKLKTQLLSQQNSGGRRRAYSIVPVST